MSQKHELLRVAAGFVKNPTRINHSKLLSLIATTAQENGLVVLPLIEMVDNYMDIHQISISDFCKQAGVTRNVLYRMRQGKSPTLISTTKIQEALAIPPQYSDGWICYFVRCDVNNALYCGCTTDITRRVKQHNAGKGARYTRTFGPVTLVYSSRSFKNRSEALKHENKLKALSKAAKEALVKEAVNGNP